MYNDIHILPSRPTARQLVGRVGLEDVVQSVLEVECVAIRYKSHDTSVWPPDQLLLIREWSQSKLPIGKCAILVQIARLSFNQPSIQNQSIAQQQQHIHIYLSTYIFIYICVRTYIHIYIYQQM